jgi:hypothetical protein
MRLAIWRSTIWLVDSYHVIICDFRVRDTEQEDKHGRTIFTCSIEVSMSELLNERWIDGDSWCGCMTRSTGPTAQSTIIR